LKGVAKEIEVTAGPYDAAGDRCVKRQQTPLQTVDVYSASVVSDHRTLMLATAPQHETVRYAVRLPGLGREGEPLSPGSLPQESAIDVDD
jgi:hypothetical protein